MANGSDLAILYMRYEGLSPESAKEKLEQQGIPAETAQGGVMVYDDRVKEDVFVSQTLPSRTMQIRDMRAQLPAWVSSLKS